MLNGLVMAFLVGGIICAIAQLVMDLTCLPPGHIMVLTVMLGAVLGGFGIYDFLVKLGGAGATIPLTSFGNALTKGAILGIKQFGWIGAFKGVLQETSLGISVAIFMAWILALFFNPKG